MTQDVQSSSSGSQGGPPGGTVQDPPDPARTVTDRIRHAAKADGRKLNPGILEFVTLPDVLPCADLWLRPDMTYLQMLDRARAIRSVIAGGEDMDENARRERMNHCQLLLGDHNIYAPQITHMVLRAPHTTLRLIVDLAERYPQIRGRALTRMILSHFLPGKAHA